tara:strand:+ start:694 stop:1008 length:315 start_codon:yes stop_codon:yes gene_type:complete
MEQVSVQIPAKLYFNIYQNHGESTGQQIIRTLEALCEGNPPSSTATSNRPGPGTITGEVWRIADEFKAKHGAGSRTGVVEACMEAGINMNTASTQYSYWLKENS